jgi:prevent-host-death family protein
MTREITATEAKRKFLALLDEVEAGEEIEITRDGVAVARLSPARATTRAERHVPRHRDQFCEGRRTLQHR